jgi:hypothetical protein
MPLEAGGSVELEIDDDSGAAVMRGGLPRPLIETTVVNFETAVAKVKPVALAVVRQFTDAIHGTSSVKVKFGLKFTADAGAIIASVGSEANFEIEVTWSRSANDQE